jgi:hypothetical protein
MSDNAASDVPWIGNAAVTQPPTSHRCPRCGGTGKVTQLAMHEMHYHEMVKTCACGMNEYCRVCGFGHGGYPCACTKASEVPK